jgi:hypothetical protein
MNVSLPVGWLFGSAVLEVQFPSSTSRFFIANSSQIANVVELNMTSLSLNTTGQYAFRFNNQTGGITDWVTFSVVPQMTSGMNAYEIDVLSASEQSAAESFSNTRITYNLNMQLDATDSQYYIIHLDNLSNYGSVDWSITPGNGQLERLGSVCPYCLCNSPSFLYLYLNFSFTARDVVELSNTVFSFPIFAQYPIYDGMLHFTITATSNNSSREIDLQWPQQGRSSMSYTGMISCEDSYIVDNPLSDVYYLAAYPEISGSHAAWVSLSPIITLQQIHDLSDYSEWHYDSLGDVTSVFPVFFAIPALNCSWNSTNPSASNLNTIFGANYFWISTNTTINPYWYSGITTGIQLQTYNVYIISGGSRILLKGSNLQLGIKLHGIDYNSGGFFHQEGFLNLTSDSYTLPIGSQLQSISYYVWDSQGKLIGEVDDINPSNTTITINVPVEYASHTVYFAAFSNDGLGVPTDTVALFIDGQRIAWGAVSLSGGIHEILVQDYFGITQFDSTVDLTYISQYSIFINMATLALYNNQTENYLTFVIIKNDRQLLSQLLPPQNTIIFRFAAGLYLIEAYYSNGTLADSRKISLSANSTESLTFGITTGVTAPFTVADIVNPVTESCLYVVIGVFAIGLVGVLVVSRRSSSSKKKTSSARKSRREGEINSPVGSRHS